MTDTLNYQNNDNGIGFYINQILKQENKNPLSKKEILQVNKFDDAVLIIDDLLDKSKIRNGKRCYYLMHGEEGTRKLANRLFDESKNTLKEIAIKHDLNKKQILGVLKTLSELKDDIDTAQAIDKELVNTREANESLLEKYKEMIILFTGNHIKTGYKIGYLLSKEIPDSDMLEKGKKMGIIRQIQDDVDDYSHKHHEPLNDLLSHKKRLPELLFLLNSSLSERRELQVELDKENLDIEKIKKIILNPKIIELVDQEIKQYNF